MKILMILCAMMAQALARSTVLLTQPVITVAPLAYANLVQGAPIGLDGRVVDTPEVAIAKAEHAVAHVNERITLANEAIKSADVTYAAVTPILSDSVLTAKILPAAPIGLDGRVVDTPEVTIAKAEHAAAHVNERIGLAQEAAKSSTSSSSSTAAKTTPIEIPIVLSTYAAPLYQKYII